MAIAEGHGKGKGPDRGAQVEASDITIGSIARWPSHPMSIESGATSATVSTAYLHNSTNSGAREWKRIQEYHRCHGAMEAVACCMQMK